VVTVSDSRFVGNTVRNNGGGGIDVGYIGDSIQNNTIKFTNAFISENFAVFGGGAAIFTFNTVAFNSYHNNISWHKCFWNSNRAHYGSALNIYPQYDDDWTQTLENCTFESNMVVPRDTCNVGTATVTLQTRLLLIASIVM